MFRLSRIRGKFVNFVDRKYRQYRKSFRLMVYDLNHMSKPTLNKVYQVVLFSTTLFPSVGYLAYNALYLSDYKQRLCLKADGKPIPLDQHLELLALREFNTCHIGRHYKLMNLLQFFPCSGSEPFSAGDLASRTGAIIGFPYNFTYNTTSDVRPNELQVYGLTAEEMTSDSNQHLVQRLIDSLVLSEKAKRFAIAREMQFLTNTRTLCETLNIGLSLFLGVGIGQQIILSYRIRQRFLLSFAIRLLSLSLGLCIWFAINQGLFYSWYITADSETVGQGEDYYDGAIEYYDKLLLKNKTLYELLGKRGPKMFTEGGEVRGLFRFNTLPIRKRLEKIQELDPRAQKTDEVAEDESNVLSND